MDAVKCACIALCLCVNIVATRRYDGYKVLHVTPETEDDVLLMKQLEQRFPYDLDFWTEYARINEPVDIMVSPHLVSDIIDKLGKRNIKFNIMMDNVQSLIDKQMSDFKEEATDRKATSMDRFDYAAYHTMPEIDEWMDNVVARYSDATEIFTLTHSYEGRPVRGVKIRHPSPSGHIKPCVFLVAGVHSREWIGTVSMIFIIKELIEKYKIDPKTTKMLDTLDWYIVPVLNVDGYIYTFTDRLWRKNRRPNEGTNCIGTDLNRNWSYEWGGPDSVDDPCFITYRGLGPASTVEINGTESFLSNLQKLVVFVDWHAYSQLWMSPWSYASEANPFYESHMAFMGAASKKIKSLYGTTYRYGPVHNIIYPASGSSIDFTFGALGVKHSYAVELRPTAYARNGFLLSKDQIIPTAIEAWESVKAGIMYILEEEGV